MLRVTSKSKDVFSKLMFGLNGQRFTSSSGGRAVINRSRFAYPEGMIPPEEDYVETAEYPIINPETHQWGESRRLRRQALLDWYNQIRDQPNVEGKTMQINMPRKFGYYTHILNEEFFDYNSQDFYRFITRTKLVSGDTLPELYSSAELTEQAKHFLVKIKEPLLDALRFEMDGQSRNYENDLALTKSEIDFKQSQSIINQVNRVILSVLGSEIDHLKDCQVDHTPNLEAFWFSGGHQPTNRERSSKKGQINAPLAYKRYKGKENDPVERNLQYKGSALLQIRCKNPITNYESIDSESCKKSDAVMDRFTNDLNDFRIFREFRYASTIPGTWSGDGYDNSHIAFHPRHHLLHHSRQESKYWAEDDEDALASQAILGSFSRLFSQAMYYGFDQFSDLDYPFSTQTVLTNGINYSFFAYQLNTIQLSKLFLEKNGKQNLCWGTKSMSIFDEKNPNTLKEEVLDLLLKFYLNKTYTIKAENAKPYITAPLQKWDDEIQREIVFLNYRDMVAQRWYADDSLLIRQIPEIYEWEMIYKVKHPQRHMDSRRRFFELPSDFPGAKPYNEPYPLKNPRKIKRGLRVLQEQVAAKKELERIEASKLAETAKYTDYES